MVASVRICVVFIGVVSLRKQPVFSPCSGRVAWPIPRRVRTMWPRERATRKHKGLWRVGCVARRFTAWESPPLRFSFAAVKKIFKPSIASSTQGSSQTIRESCRAPLRSSSEDPPTRAWARSPSSPRLCESACLYGLSHIVRSSSLPVLVSPPPLRRLLEAERRLRRS